MKEKVIIPIISIIAILMSSCGSHKAPALQQKNVSPFGNVYKAPCSEYRDTKDTFVGNGIYRGSYKDKGECHLFAIENAKSIIRSKFHHSYLGMISEYISSTGNNRGKDIGTKIQIAGDEVLEMMLNDADELCYFFSDIFDDGDIECYVAIAISKEELSKRVSGSVSDKLTEEEKQKINFDDYTFRNYMYERIKKIKGDK